MITIDKALSLYTDMLNANNTIDLNYFKQNLCADDLNEFLELIEIINLGKSVKITDDFDKLFFKINKYKKSIDSLSQAASFRTNNRNDEKEVMDELERIFNEEFDDE